jgi:hypothetical protein
MANMKSRMLRIILLVFAIFLNHQNVDAQNKEQSFRDYQFSNDRVRSAWKEYEDTLQAVFTSKNQAGLQKISSYELSNRKTKWSCGQETKQMKNTGK